MNTMKEERPKESIGGELCGYSALFFAFELLAGCCIAYLLFSPAVLLVVLFGYAVLVLLDRLKRPGLTRYFLSLIFLFGILLLHDVLQLKKHELQAFGGLFFVPLGTALLRVYFRCTRVLSKEGHTLAASCIFGVLFLILGLVLLVFALKGKG